MGGTTKLTEGPGMAQEGWLEQGNLPQRGGC